MTSRGSPDTLFRHALATRDPTLVRATAAELPAIPLHYALAICLVMADSEPAAFPRYAVRWHGRFCSEVKGLTAEEAQLALAAVLALTGPGREAGVEALVSLCERRGLRRVVGALEGWAGD